MPYIQRRFRAATLTPLQHDLIARCNDGKPVLAYRRSPAQHGYGCSFLAGWMSAHKRWYSNSMCSPRHLKRALCSADVPGVVVDMAYAMEFMTANNLFRTVERHHAGRPTLVICHGSPTACVDSDKWIVVDITAEPAPY